MALWQLFADLIGEAQVCYQQADQGSRHYGKIARATGCYSGKLKDLLDNNRPYFDWIIVHYNEDGMRAKCVAAGRYPMPRSERQWRQALQLERYFLRLHGG